MKWQLAPILGLLLIRAYACAGEDFTERNSKIEQTIEIVQYLYTENPTTEPNGGTADLADSATNEEDLFAYDEWFTTPLSDAESVTPGYRPEEEETFAEPPTAAYTTDEHWYPVVLKPKLRIEKTPYSALLYQQDEFGLEFLCPGFWLKWDVLLIRMDCWLKNVDLDVDDTVTEVVLNKELHIAALRLRPHVNEKAQEAKLHLAKIRDSLPVSLDECTLYVLAEDRILFEKYSWDSRALSFKPAQAQCSIDHICLRMRPLTAFGVDYALLCDYSMVGMLVTQRTRYERVFGKLTLVDLTVAEPWIGRVLERFKDEAQPEQKNTYC